ncbi:hypothetical protein EBR57_01695 [bacterium]|nr:hypothetical protein [bacterium]
MTPPIVQVIATHVSRIGAPPKENPKPTPIQDLPVQSKLIGAVNPPLNFFPAASPAGNLPVGDIVRFGINFGCGFVGGGTESPVRAPLDTAKTVVQLKNIPTINAINEIYKTKGPQGFFPYFSNTTAVRGVQRGGLFALANTDLPIPVKTGIGYVYELLVTSINQVITTNAAGGNQQLTGNPFTFVVNQLKQYGVSALLSPYTAGRNGVFLLTYNNLMHRYQDERKTNPLTTNLAIGLAATGGSHVFDPCATYHSRFPETAIKDVPAAVLKSRGLRGLITGGLGLRLGSVGAGISICGAVADYLKREVVGQK